MEEQMEILPDNELDINLPVVYVKQLKLWSNNETKKLVSLYKTLIHEVGNRFTYKKQMWDEISTHFPDKTPQQCESRLCTMFRRKKLGKGGPKVFTTENERNSDYEVEPHLYRIRKNIQLWSNSETKLLAELYKKLIGEVGPFKRFPTKKDMWAEMSTHFTNKNPKQCESRFMRLVNTKQAGVVKFVRYKPSEIRRIKAKNSSMQIKRIHAIKEEKPVEYIEEDDPLGSTQVKEEEIVKTVQSEKSIQETLMEIAARKEETKERRHREKVGGF
ncbi:uncharacterized protein LOC119612330 [Lucilia sericata]|uniref:uncharacterized protein LOC119612330 n=1 Tax=Lucilia sericata TaxID=13632 RepID=UPI0018A842CE|nr:uncharacterized protein LOC119612330 [Lucilia sericata]